MSGQEGIAGVRPSLAEHIWLETPYPMTEELAEHVAAAVVAWIEEMLASEAVREAALADWERASYDERWAAGAGYDAALAALREQP